MVPRTRRRTVRTARSRVHGAREEGLVMLVVMLVLMLATASAAMSMATVQSEVKAMGNERQRVQAQYLAETALASTLSWFDVAENDFVSVWQAWERSPPPAMTRFGEPSILPTHGVAGRMQMGLHDRVVAAAAFTDQEVSPVDEGLDGTGIGSFGPRQAYLQTEDGYNVDVTDCMKAPFSEAGFDASGSTGGRMRCSVTARAELALDDERGVPTDDATTRRTRKWRVDGQDYLQSAFSRRYEIRAVIDTPPTL